MESQEKEEENTASLRFVMIKSCIDLTTQGMNPVNGFENRWPACWSHDLCLLVFPKCTLFSSFSSCFSWFSHLKISPTTISPSHPRPTQAHSHNTALGIITDMSRGSNWPLTPVSRIERGPTLCLSVACRGQRQYCRKGLLTGRSFFTYCFFF